MSNHYVKYNANPEGRDVGDCTVRAIATATGKDWEKVYVDLCIYGFMRGDLPNANAVWHKYLKDNGFHMHTIPESCPDCYTVEMFCEDHPAGTYVVALATHVVCVINGKLYDTWDSSTEYPIFYWEGAETNAG